MARNRTGLPERFQPLERRGGPHPWFGRLLLCTTDDMAAIE